MMAEAELQSRNGEQARAALHRIWNIESTTTPSSATSSSKLPQTSSARITESSNTHETPTTEKTILYLAYGSNLSAETFRGSRGIRPLSAVNVHVPSLDLTFSLPGIPYKEPCFANTRYREAVPSSSDDRKNRWQKGLVGVVYEVTPEDYRTILATEGGGAGYQDVIVPCFVIPPGTKVVHPSPSGTPFEAHTLLAPAQNKDGRSILRPDPNYAQASARYLKLITDGAEEHELPADYTAYLYNFRPYTITTYRQVVGQALFLATWVPILVFLMGLSRIVADKDGMIPRWLVRVHGVVFRVIWASYDRAFKKVFGDGERTINETEEEGQIEPVWREKGIRLDGGV